MQVSYAVHLLGTNQLRKRNDVGKEDEQGLKDDKKLEQDKTTGSVPKDK